jgi:hypothetical protein
VIKNDIWNKIYIHILLIINFLNYKEASLF